MQRDVLIIVRKNGDRFIPEFPVELKPGDQCVIARETNECQVPRGQKWTVKGYSSSGPIISRKS